MPTPAFEDKNRNGYPDNFEQEEAVLQQQIAARKKQFKI
jgi:hypothetical protein